MAQTYLVECFWPGITEPARDEAAVRAGAAAQQLRASGREVRFLDALLVPDDEVVFFRFAAASRSDVEHASTLADLPFERVTEYLEASETSDDGPGT